jgi:hypothetical protein
VHFTCALCAPRDEQTNAAEVQRKESDMHINQFIYNVISAAIKIHRMLGPSLLESTYEECLCRALMLRGFV